MPKETQQIDLLFLELSQFTTAKTWREVELERELAELTVINKQLALKVAELSQSHQVVHTDQQNTE
jgi:hypothetical protein